MGFKKIFGIIGKSAMWALGIAQTLPQTKHVAGAVDVLGKVGLVTSSVELAATAIGGQKNGAEKMNAVLNQIVPMLQVSELVSGRDIVDETLFAEGAKDIAEGVLKIQKSLVKK